MCSPADVMSEAFRQSFPLQRDLPPAMSALLAKLAALEEKPLISRLTSPLGAAEKRPLRQAQVA
jgi:hypothetical protein